MSAIVLFSGGIDSTALLWKMKAEDYVLALSINYGQRHVRELEHAKALADLASVQWRYMSIPTLPKMRAAVGKDSIIPNRNMILLAHAVSIAIECSYDSVLYAAHRGDSDVYPDCRPGFMAAMQEAVCQGNDGKIVVGSPFVNMSKTEVLKVALDLDVPLGLTWSCYLDRSSHCGTCGACIERRRAFSDAGVHDPTIYA